MAIIINERLSLEIENEIVQQSAKIARTNTGADYRLAFNPAFKGDVKQGQNYLIVDDTLTMGGTVAFLRGYIENRGGKVIAASVMTAHKGALNLPVKPSMLAAIGNKHGPSMDQFWQERFGYEINKLTQGEAGHLKSAKTVDTIRDRIIATRHEGINQIGKSRIEASLCSKGTSSGLTGENLASSKGASVEQVYQETLAIYVQAKHDQIESIEKGCYLYHY